MKNSKFIGIRFLIFTFTLTISSFFLFGQAFQGRIIKKGTNNPLRYVNIGIPLKNIGTVSNDKGEYLLNVPSGFENDSVKFSCIGFRPTVVKMIELKENKTIYLEKNIYTLNDIITLPKKTKHLELLELLQRQNDLRRVLRIIN